MICPVHVGDGGGRARTLLAASVVGGGAGRALRRSAEPPLRRPAVTAPTPASMATSVRVPASLPPLTRMRSVRPAAAVLPAPTDMTVASFAPGTAKLIAPATAPPVAAAPMRPQSLISP